MNKIFLHRIVISLFLFLPITITAQLPEIHKSIIALHDEVMNYVQNLPKEDKFDPPPPPSMYFDYCFPCDKERQQIYIRDSTNFMNACWGKDTVYINKANTVLNFFTNRRLYKFAYDTIRGQQMEANLVDAKITISERFQSRLLAAWKKYGNQDDKLPFLFNRLSDQYRLHELVGVKLLEGMPLYGTLQQLLVYAQLRILAKAKKELDYRFLLNTPWIIDIFRTAELMGMKAENLPDNLMNYLKVNQFLFTIETKAKIRGQDGGHYLASLSSQEILAATPDRDCHLKWSLGADTLKMHYQLNDIRMIPPKGEVPTYVGDNAFSSPAPQIKLDFCDDKRDTAHFYGFKKDGDGEKWQIKGIIAPAAVSLAAYMIAFPDTRQYSQFQRGGVVTTYAVPFGFYVKQVPWNYHKVILEKTVYSKDVSQYPQYVDYGEFKLKIEYVDQ